MARHIWTVLCTKSITDSSSNNMTLFDVTEQLNVSPATPLHGTKVVPIQLQLVSLWTRDDLQRPENAQGRITHVDVDGTHLRTWEVEIDLVEKRRRRVIMGLGSLPITAAGEQEFRVECQRADDVWEVVARVPLEINVAEARGRVPPPS